MIYQKVFVTLTPDYAYRMNKYKSKGLYTVIFGLDTTISKNFFTKYKDKARELVMKWYNSSGKLMLRQLLTRFLEHIEKVGIRIKPIAHAIIIVPKDTSSGLFYVPVHVDWYIHYYIIDYPKKFGDKSTVAGFLQFIANDKEIKNKAKWDYWLNKLGISYQDRKYWYALFESAKNNIVNKYKNTVNNITNTVNQMVTRTTKEIQKSVIQYTVLLIIGMYLLQQLSKK